MTKIIKALSIVILLGVIIISTVVGAAFIGFVQTVDETIDNISDVIYTEPTKPAAVAATYEPFFNEWDFLWDEREQWFNGLTPAEAACWSFNLEIVNLECLDELTYDDATLSDYTKGRGRLSQRPQ